MDMGCYLDLEPLREICQEISDDTFTHYYLSQDSYQLISKGFDGCTLLCGSLFLGTLRFRKWKMDILYEDVLES